MVKPKRVLEVGTAIGFSSILMSECLEPGSIITTIENYGKRIPVARENFRRAGKETVITLLEGDAREVMKGLEPYYDFYFYGCCKGPVHSFSPGGHASAFCWRTLVSDNVLQDGDVIESRYAVTRRDRTIHSRMRQYLWELKHMDALETVVLPIGDGVTISTRLK